jgi:hypothetical protein
VHFLLNPENMRLGGPCPRCGRYFYKQILRGDQCYCSSECSRKGTSSISHRKERKEAKQQKIEKVQGMIKKLKKSQIKGWKKAINGLAPEIKLHWLTRAVNRGEIEEPTEKA